MKLKQQLLQNNSISQSMQQSLNILSLSNEELSEMIQAESLENPLLDIENGPQWVSQESETFKFFNDNKKSKGKEDEHLFFQDHLSEPESLKTHLLKQKDQSFYKQELKFLIEILISYLDERGYLRVSPQEIAEKNQIPTRKVSKALKLLQTFEPSGVGARTLEECLLIQIKHKKIHEPLLKQLVSYHLELLKDKKYPYIARELGVSLEKVNKLTQMLKKLQPNPAFNFSSEPTVFIKPDVFIYKKGSSFFSSLNKDNLAQLSFSSSYFNFLSKKNSLSNKEKKYLQTKKKTAEFLIQAIQEREDRIKKSVSFIIKHQQASFVKGFQYLKALKMTDLAKELDVHISTLSRTINNKYAHTPHGILALKDFFSRETQGSPVNSLSVQKIKLRLKKWVEEEDPQSPLCDEALKTRIEKTFNVSISRRRVAQYRVQLNIPQKRLRRLSFLYESQP